MNIRKIKYRSTKDIKDMFTIFNNKHVLITGKFKHYTRHELRKLLSGYGCSFASHSNSSVRIVLYSNRTTRKYINMKNIAEHYISDHILFINENEFYKLLTL